jgi:polyisoprenoid-binding protein YceI
MKKITLILSMALIAMSAVNAQTLSSEKSLVKFSIKNMQTRTVKGSFTGMKGEIQFDENDLANSSFKVTIDATTVDTENEKRDDHLRNADFFHVEEYPQITFESKSIQKTPDGYVTKGNLTMHGVSKEVEIPFTFDNKQFSGILEVNRFDYKIGEGTKRMMVDETARLEIIAVTDGLMGTL